MKYTVKIKEHNAPKEKNIKLQKLKKFISENTFSVVGIAFCLFLVGLIVFMTCYAFQKDKEFNEWYASLTPEQQQEYQLEQERKYQENVHRYEVVGVSKYVRNQTNQFGAITDTDICYAFEYKDGSGKLHSIQNFEHLDYGLTKVIIGDTNMYIVDTNSIDTYQYLQLTEETLSELKIS